MKYKHYILKRKIENIFIYPFVWVGRIIAAIKPLKQEYKIFFFFPFYHTGGAEKVHALITQAIGNSDCIIFFTRKSGDNTFLQDFTKSHCTIRDIATFTDNKWLYFLNLIYRGVITGYLHQQKQQPIVFNGQCNFGYKISPWIKKDIRQFELIHSFNTFSWIRIPFVEYYEKTVMISKVRIENHFQQYQELDFPTQLKQKITYICNGISLPDSIIYKDYTQTIKVLFVGRGTPEKRADLFAAIAAEVHKANESIEFIMAGDVAEAIPMDLKNNVQILGNIEDEKELRKLYEQAHILVITSNTEGFPMVVMEAMSYGCAIIATPVGDLPVHVKENENGFITKNIDFDNVRLEIANKIKLLSQDRMLLNQFYQRNINYSKQHFSINLFKNKYRELLNL